MISMPYKIMTLVTWKNTKQINNIRSWLTVNIGEPYVFWMTDYYDGHVYVKFKQENDALLFALRWL